MKFSLIICTYKRAKPLLKLLDSISVQDVYPDEILIIDGSPDNTTREAVYRKSVQNLKFFSVPPEYRGLTLQRNFGIQQVIPDSKVICFLDDDVVLQPDYFKNLLDTYRIQPEAVGAGGYILNEVHWEQSSRSPSFGEYKQDRYIRPLGSRNLLRKKLGLLSDKPPGIMPEFSNGLSISFLPPSGKMYPVEFFMGGVASYRRELFDKLKFSSYFEGYGLYEDMDFCLRASKIGQLFVNTAAQLYHYHEEGGRPNKFKYGKMVMRNGWYVWRVKYPNPDLNSKLKWHGTALLLALVRLGNTFNTSKKKEAFVESMGRLCGWISLLFQKTERHEEKIEN